MRPATHRTACASLAFVPFALYACGALKDGEDRAQGERGDAGQASPDGGGDTSRDVGDGKASGEATLDASDAQRDATADGEADIVDSGPLRPDAPQGTPVPLVLGSSTFQLLGFTSDGRFIYRDQGSIYAISLAGGARELIFAEPPDSSALPSAWIQGALVVVSTGGSTDNHIAVIWTHAMGPRPAPAHVVDLRASMDGTRLGYTIADRFADGGIAGIQFAESHVDLSNPIVFPTIPPRSFP